jgi:ABC-type sugar transport system ATPase subunit
VVVGVRPEDVKFSASADVENRFAGNVLATTFLGDQATAEVKIKDKILLAKTLPDDAKPVGAVSVHLPKQKIVVFPEAQSKQVLAKF